MFGLNAAKDTGCWSDYKMSHNLNHFDNNN